MAKKITVKNFLALSVLLVIISVSATILVLTQWQQELSSVTGKVSGIAQVEVICLVAISLPASSVNFGAVPQGYSDDTADNSPLPMVVQNDGGIKVDISIARDSASNPLFNGTGGGDNSTSFQFKIDNTNETGSFDYAQSLVNWTKVPGTASLTAIKALKYSDTKDSAEIDLKIQVPADEPLGKKNETLNFVAVSAEEAECGDEACEDDDDCPEGYVCEAGHCIQETEDSDCITFDLTKKEYGISGNGELGVMSEQGYLRNIWLENSCGHEVAITKIRINWTANYGEKTEKVAMKTPPHDVVWIYDCDWGCSPAGKQGSGTLLDFGSRDSTIEGGEDALIQEIKFDSGMEGKTFNIELTFSDGSTASTGNFSP